ncbi:MAG TPA: ABC transporter permease [Jatrophihabitantaceae bacterium]
MHEQAVASGTEQRADRGWGNVGEDDAALVVGADSLGLLLRTPNAVMRIGFVILFPITFMSDVFVDPHTMPHWLRTITDVNPMSQLVTAARGLTAGQPSATELVWVLAATTTLTAADRRALSAAAVTAALTPPRWSRTDRSAGR